MKSTRKSVPTKEQAVWTVWNSADISARNGTVSGSKSGQEVQALAGEACGDTEAKRKQKETRNNNGHGQGNPAGHSTGNWIDV